MWKLILISLMIFPFSNAFGSLNESKMAFGVGLFSRMEKNINGLDYDSQNVQMLFLSYNINKKFQFNTELSFFSFNEGNSSVGINRDHFEYMSWIKYYPPLFNNGFRPYLGLGAGVFQEIIKTRLYTESRTSKGEFLLQWGAQAGLGYVFWPRVITELDAKIKTAGDVLNSKSQEITYEMGAKIGYIF